MEKLKKIGKYIVNRYLIEALSGMALGLFSTLMVGLILKQLGGIAPASWFGNLLIQLGSLASVMAGVGIGVGVAHALNVPKMVLYSTVVTGFLGANASKLVAGTLIAEGGGVLLLGPGDPIGAFVAAVVGAEIGRLISGKTKLDIIITPITTIVSGGIAAVMVAPSLASFMTLLGATINQATMLRPFWMGIIVSVMMGMILTLPISSAAISMILGLSGLAAGAATAGCSAQMIGFAVASYRENKVNGLLAQGLGTSMLQVPNIVRNPRIWIPAIITSAITGPMATVIFQMHNNAAGAGMGTSGLVGVLMTWQTMNETTNKVVLLGSILLLYFILPAVITLGISEFMRRKGWIKDGDMKLDV
ncbi:MAG TPA: PTS sugar transporter subunit IIC [Epulopiscium sp.]|nr:PTS sugar transporter subunit IIC [Candidatus Epulonipiscium sp.]